MKKTSNLCDYGCGQEAQHQLKNGKWCCSDHHSKCEAVRQKNINKHKGRIFSEEHKKNISESKKGSTPWNKGKKGLQKAWNKDLKLTPLTDEHKNKLKDATSKDKNGNWKGGYSSRNIPTYDFFYDKLTIEEDPKRVGFDKNILSVVCSQCKKRFIPKLTCVYERVRSLNGNAYGENRLYCSEKCKQKCSVFGKKSNQMILNTKNYTQSEYQTFRKFVLERDNYVCQYCGKKAEHVHHERPQKSEPFFALDPDLAWSVCVKCHYEKGHVDECSTGNLSSKIC